MSLFASHISSPGYRCRNLFTKSMSFAAILPAAVAFPKTSVISVFVEACLSFCPSNISIGTIPIFAPMSPFICVTLIDTSHLSVADTFLQSGQIVPRGDDNVLGMTYEDIECIVEDQPEAVT